MIRLPWNLLVLPVFILLVLQTGCRERLPPVEELVRQAETLLDSGQIEQAVAILERCQERAPARVDVLEPLAFAYAAKGDPIQAALVFKRMAELVPERPEYLLYAAQSLLEAEEPTGAATEYEAYLAVQPRDRAVWVALGDLRIRQGRLNQALEALLAAEQLESRSAQQLAIGELYLRSANLAQAQAWYARALAGQPPVRDQALLGLLETAIRARRFANAETLLHQLDTEFPRLLEQTELGPARAQLQEWRQRQDAAREALAAMQAPPPEPAPEDAPALAAVEEPVAEPPPPADLPAPPPELEPAPPPDPLAEARALRADGRLADAIRAYRQVLVANDGQPLVWAELSQAYLEAGEDAWAQATASEALRRDPDNPRLVLQYLRVAQRSVQPERLLREMEAFYRRFPDQPELVLVLARAYAAQGNFRNASLLLHRYLDLVPPDHPNRPIVLEEFQNLGR